MVPKHRNSPKPLARLQKDGLCLATNNVHKLAEFRRILGPLGISVRSPQELGISLEVEENAPDFSGNALLKAQEGYRLASMPCLADDSGLCVPALGNEPGVKSARYGGPGFGDKERVDFLLKRMKGLSGAERRAFFVCVLALCLGTHKEDAWFFEGKAYGSIAQSPRGKQGFGYDPVFLSQADGRSFAELSPTEKDARSHRGAAIKKLLDFLQADKGTI